MNDANSYHILRLIKNLKYRLVWQGVLVGIFAGLIVSFYRFILIYAEKFSIFAYTAAKENPKYIAIIFAVLVLAGIFVGKLTIRQPMIKGSGIPQVEGQILGFFHISWWRVIISKIIGGTVALAAGLSLGREGPSIQLGAAAGEGISDALGRDDTEKKYLLTCGASAGLAAAFNAPLAGMLFSLEEVHKNFSVNVLVSAMASAVTADVVSKLFFGMESVFGSHPLINLPLQYYYLLPILGILLGLFGWFYNKTLLYTQKLYGKITFIKKEYVMIIPFIAAGIAGIVIPDILGGGHKVISALLYNKMAFYYIIILLTAKFVFSMISFGSGAPGGIFFPLLVLGALGGAAFGKLGIEFLGVDEQFYINFLLLGMVGMFTGIVRAPVTGIVLIVEMSGSLTQMLAAALVAVCSYLTADMLGSKPIYESLLENIKPVENKDNDTKEKILLNFAVEAGSAADNSEIKSLSWPEHCLAVSIIRGETELIPNGDSVLHTGDYVVVMCPEINENNYREELSEYFTKS